MSRRGGRADGATGTADVDGGGQVAIIHVSTTQEESQGQPPQQQQQPSSSRFRLWFSKFRYNGNEDPKEVREVLLIVSALIAAVTFQAGVNPPGGVWQDTVSGHVAGCAIYASHEMPFYVFLVCNTMALSAAISTIISLTYKFPFSVEIWIATLSMIVTYGSSIFAITPREQVRFRYILTAAAVPWVARLVAELTRFSMNRFGICGLGGS